MALLKGIDVVLHGETQTGTDAFNRPITTKTDITVHNVLVAPTGNNGEEILTELSMDGKKATYMLAIPKDDTNIWEDKTVSFFDAEWKVIGYPKEGITHLIPLDWNKKVVVERVG